MPLRRFFPSQRNSDLNKTMGLWFYSFQFFIEYNAITITKVA